MRILALITLLLCSLPALAKHYIIGAQNIHYYPHYDFQSSVDKGLGWAILEAYAKSSGHQFSYHAMPITRLQRELNKGNVDFIYPDNPQWYVGTDAQYPKTYSGPLVRTLGGTIVRPEDVGKGVAYVKRLSFPLGFSPAIWQSKIDEGLLDVVPVNDTMAALELLQRGRVQAANLEYNVVQYIASVTPNLGPFILDTSLPYVDVGFRLSTLNHPELIADLNVFLAENAPLLQQLYQQYKIRPPNEIITQLTSTH